jgi:DNA polymerase-3 subunit epsilon
MQIIIDTETTGLDDEAQAIEIAIINAEDGGVIFNELISPTVKVTKGALSVHGIGPTLLEDKEKFPFFFGEITGIFEQSETIYAYNSDFDFRIMRQTARAFAIGDERLLERKWACVMREYVAIWGEPKESNPQVMKWQSLSNALKQQGIDVKKFEAHRALADCQMTYELLKKIKQGTINSRYTHQHRVHGQIAMTIKSTKSS